MSRWLIICLLAACDGAQAMPGAPAEEDASGIVMADQRLLTKLEHVSTRLEQVGTKLEQVGSTVTDRASDLVITAMGFLGVPYKRGGNTAESGFDCSGFVRAMYQSTIGLVLPRRANEQAAATEKIDKKDLRPGDLVFFNTMKRAFSHVGIYVGEGKFIHSPKPGAQVRVEDMGQNYWQRRFDGARRVLSQMPADPQASRQP
jgi:cell wall-associated NlpC family hydrolase